MHYVVAGLMGLCSVRIPAPLLAQRPGTVEDFRPFVKFFHAVNPAIAEFHVVDQRKIDRQFSVVVLRGTVPREEWVYSGDFVEVARQELFGVFIADSARQKPVLGLDVFPTKRILDYEVRVEHAGRENFVVSRQGATYGDVPDRVKYFYDPTLPNLIKKIEYMPPYVRSEVEFGGRLYFFGTVDTDRSIIIQLSVNRRISSAKVEVIEEIAGGEIPLIVQARREKAQLVLQSEAQEFVLSDDAWTTKSRPFRPDVDGAWYAAHIPEFGPVPTRAELARMEDRTLETQTRDEGKLKFFVCAPDYLCPEANAGIVEFSESRRAFHPLPQPTFDTFERYRPRRTRDGYTRQNTQIREEVGPIQLVGDRIWFGGTFYDGEGITGVGGFGHFHMPTRKFRFHHYHEIADWSASAMLVEQDAIWLGLVRRPEGDLYPGGLVRFDRKTGTFVKFDVPAVINKIVRAEEAIYLGTSARIFGLVGGEIIQWEFEPDVNGKYAFKSKGKALVRRKR